jgi:hypothetical protein
MRRLASPVHSSATERLYHPAKIRESDGTQLHLARLPSTEIALELLMGTRHVLRLQPPSPLGEVTVVPAALTGRAETDMARAMAAALSEFELPSATDVLGRLRQAFPFAPLRARVVALGLMMERSRRPGGPAR